MKGELESSTPSTHLLHAELVENAARRLHTRLHACSWCWLLFLVRVGCWLFGGCGCLVVDFGLLLNVVGVVCWCLWFVVFVVGCWLFDLLCGG
jgi:hypothetical protein